MLKKVLILSVFTVASSFAASVFAEETADTYKAALETATANQKAAAAVGGEWRDVGKLLKKADEAAKEGDFAKAVKLANKAAFQGETGKAQMEAQSNLDFPSYFTEEPE